VAFNVDMTIAVRDRSEAGPGAGAAAESVSEDVSTYVDMVVLRG
jgi:hypothetical protein